MLEYSSIHGKQSKPRRRRIGEISDRLAKELAGIPETERKRLIILNSIKTQMRRA
jgi:hypothetical protein